jgi:isocitrate dehydrogenase kinase/phosphatase
MQAVLVSMVQDFDLQRPLDHLEHYCGLVQQAMIILAGHVHDVFPYDRAKRFKGPAK